MSSEIKKIDLQEKLYSIKANNPFEDFSYLRAMEQSNSASEKSGWIPDHLGEIKNKNSTRFSQVTHYHFEGCEKYFNPLFTRLDQNKYGERDLNAIRIPYE